MRSGAPGTRLVKTNIARIAGEIIRQATDMGFHVMVSLSKRTKSRYLTLCLPQDRRLTVRIADHENRRNRFRYAFDIHTQRRRKGSLGYGDLSLLLKQMNRSVKTMMNHLNSVLLEGNMAEDPLLQPPAEGIPCCTFSVASQRFYKQDSVLYREVSAVEVEAWASLAAYAYAQGAKGLGVRVVGRLKQKQAVGENGEARSRIVIAAEHIEFRPYREEGGSRV